MDLNDALEPGNGAWPSGGSSQPSPGWPNGGPSQPSPGWPSGGPSQPSPGWPSAPNPTWPGGPASGPGQPAPAWGGPASGPGQPAPAWGGPASGPGQPAPAWGGPASGPGQPAPAWGGPASGPGQPAPAWGGPASGPGQPHHGPVKVPYNQKFPNGLHDQMLITINGKVNPHANMFTMDFSTGRDLAFHFNARFNEDGKKVIVRNSRIHDKWGKEERTGNFPFVQGQSFEIKVLVTREKYNVAVNGQHLLEFRHQVHDLRSVTHLSIYNDISLTFVEAK